MTILNAQLVADILKRKMKERQLNIPSNSKEDLSNVGNVSDLKGYKISLDLKNPLVDTTEDEVAAKIVDSIERKIETLTNKDFNSFALSTEVDTVESYLDVIFEV